MAKHRTYSIEFKRQVAQEYIAGETLHAPLNLLLGQSPARAAAAPAPPPVGSAFEPDSENPRLPRPRRRTERLVRAPSGNVACLCGSSLVTPTHHLARPIPCYPRPWAAPAVAAVAAATPVEQSSVPRFWRFRLALPPRGTKMPPSRSASLEVLPWKLSELPQGTLVRDADTLLP
jgi:hypothetical protein